MMMMSTMDVGVGVAAVGLRSEYPDVTHSNTVGLGSAGLGKEGKARAGLVFPGLGQAWIWLGFSWGREGLVLACFQLGQVGQLGLAWWGQGQARQLGFGSFWVSGAGKAGRAAWFQLGQLGLAQWGQVQAGQLGRLGFLVLVWLGQLKGRLGLAGAGRARAWIGWARRAAGVPV
ncbi:hypothetical protein BY996DRAFT_8390931 [Phakopsora pachyrhizi]|nr:hypothetical protein BY996DRAFT_8390931 [Phakopsora pachyrhizi]